MKQTLLALAVIVGIGLLALFLIERPSNERRGMTPPSEALSNAPESRSLSRVVTTPKEWSEARVVAPLDDREASEEDGSTSPQSASERPTLRGRFLLPSGEPAVRVQVQASGWQSNQARVLKFGLPEDWKDPSGETGTDGRFELTFDPPRAYQFVLKATLEGYAKTSWRWSSLPIAETTDVGDVTLERAGSIAGYVLDAQGERFKSGWRVYADASEKVGRGRDATRGISGLDPATGQFRIEGMPAGPTELKANSRIANWIDGPVVNVHAGEVTEANIQYTGADLSRRISVVSFTRPFYVFSSEPESIELYREGELVGKLERVEGSSQTHTIEDLDPNGTYNVEITDERFLPWSKKGLRPGESVNAHLKGNAGVILTVLDDESGERVGAFDLRVRFPNAQFGPAEFQVVEAKDGELEGDLVDGLIPRTQKLIVSCDGYAKSAALVEDLAPNETRPVTMRLRRGSSLAGRVLQSNGSIAAGAELRLAPGRMTGEAWAELLDPWGLKSTASLRTLTADGNGTFEFADVLPGQWSLHASWSGLAHHEVIEVTKAATILNVSFPPTGTLEGVLAGPDGALLEGLVLYLLTEERAAALRSPTYESDLGKARAVTNAEGAFRVALLPTGKTRVLLALPEQSLPSSFSSGSSLRAPWICLGDVDPRAGEPTSFRAEVGADFPGQLHVTANLDGSPAAGAVVIAHCESDRTRGRRGGSITADGTALLPRLFPGEYRIEIYTLTREWNYQGEKKVTIEAAGTSRFHAEIVTVQGTLTLQDSATDPLPAGTPIGWRLSDSPENRSIYRQELGADGTLELKILPGRYEFGILGDFGRFESDLVAVDWALGGPTEPTLRLARTE